MAEGLLRHTAGDRFDVESAGMKASSVRSEAIAAMKEIGIDISGHRSKSIDEFASRPFDYVITVCDRAKQNCPIFPDAEPIHWGFDDPASWNRWNKSARFDAFATKFSSGCGCGCGIERGGGCFSCRRYRRCRRPRRHPGRSG